MPAPVHNLLLLLTALAVGAVQLFAPAAGFICRCHGTPVAVESAACHAPCCPHGHDEPEPAPLPHEPAVEVMPLVMVAPFILAVLPPAEQELSAALARGILLARTLAEHRAELKPPDDSGAGPPAALIVAETVVWLI